MGAREFSLKIDAEFHEVVELGLVKFLQVIALEAYDGIKSRVPVDTGFARGTIHMSVGEPIYAVQGNSHAVLSLTEPDEVFITGAAEYLSYLEDGHSQQAPSGFIAITIAELEAKYRRVD